MLDAYVIEEIKRRDRGQAQEDRPVVELPVPGLPPPPAGEGKDEDGPDDRGVVIIDYSS
jgi:hypothetical protein